MTKLQETMQAQRAAREAGKQAADAYLKSQGTFAQAMRECIGKTDTLISAWEKGALARFACEADAFVKANGGSVKVNKAQEREVTTDGTPGMARSIKSIQNDASKVRAIMHAFRLVNARVKQGEDLDAWRAALSQGTIHTLYSACVNLRTWAQHETLDGAAIQRKIAQATMARAQEQGLTSKFSKAESLVRHLSLNELVALRIKLNEQIKRLGERSMADVRADARAAKAVRARESSERQAHLRAAIQQRKAA